MPLMKPLQTHHMSHLQGLTDSWTSEDTKGTGGTSTEKNLAKSDQMINAGQYFLGKTQFGKFPNQD